MLIEMQEIHKIIQPLNLPIEISRTLTLGLCRRLGFTQKEICSFMDISQKMHSHLLFLYQQSVRTHENTPIHKLYDTKDTLKQIALHIYLIEKEFNIGLPQNHIFTGFPDADI